MSDEIIWVGERVRKTEGYRFEGVVLCAFSTSKGQPRLVVEHDDGWAFIMRPDQVEKQEPKQCSYPGFHHPHGQGPSLTDVRGRRRPGRMPTQRDAPMSVVRGAAVRAPAHDKTEVGGAGR